MSFSGFHRSNHTGIPVEDNHDHAQCLKIINELQGRIESQEKQIKELKEEKKKLAEAHSELEEIKAQPETMIEESGEHQCHGQTSATEDPTASVTNAVIELPSDAQGITDGGSSVASDELNVAPFNSPSPPTSVPSSETEDQNNHHQFVRQDITFTPSTLNPPQWFFDLSLEDVIAIQEAEAGEEDDFDGDEFDGDDSDGDGDDSDGDGNESDGDDSDGDDSDGDDSDNAGYERWFRSLCMWRRQALGQDISAELAVLFPPPAPPSALPIIAGLGDTSLFYDVHRQRALNERASREAVEGTTVEHLTMEHEEIEVEGGNQSGDNDKDKDGESEGGEEDGEEEDGEEEDGEEDDGEEEDGEEFDNEANNNDHIEEQDG